MSAVAFIYCEICPEQGNLWYKAADFEISSGTSFQRALEGASLSDRGLPPDFESEYIENALGATWFIADELPKLLDARLWMRKQDLERVPPHAYEGYADLEAIQAWQAFAKAYENHGYRVRFVVWFLW